MPEFDLISSNKSSWKEDIKNILKMLPKIEDKIIKQLDEMVYVKDKILKITVEDKKKFEITIKIIE